MITIFDLETTGVNPYEDRIVSIYAKRGDWEFFSLVNPLRPIPKEATAIHGITDEDVRTKGLPWFAVGTILRPMFEGAILCGYNSRRFDTIMLHCEYERESMIPPFSLETVQEIDVLAVWRSMETQNLSSAVRRWLDRDLKAHDAKEDATASWDVLRAIQKRYDLTTEECLRRSLETSRSPFLEMKNGEWHFSGGMHRGKPCKDYPSYLEWILGGTFDAETKRIAETILRN